MRFIKSFPGSDGGCCAEMTRPSVCTPCCVDNFDCAAHGPLSIPGYFDGYFGLPAECAAACTTGHIGNVWDGTFDVGVPGFFGGCAWGAHNPGGDLIYTFGGDTYGILTTGISRTVYLPLCISFYVFVISCTISLEVGNCFI